jgi:dihydroorotate dehydrogenase/Pyruvate/2-oxoacid:ferredoxin oxidoreductase delta subunit
MAKGDKMSTLKQQVGNLTISSPIMVASGPLTDSPDLIKKAEDYGAGCVSTKLTLLEQPIKGHRRMYAVRGMYTFNPSDKRNDFEQGLELVYKTKRIASIPVFANIAGPGGNIEGWIKISKGMEEAGADALELNFTCPNMAFSKTPDGKVAGAMVGRNPALMKEIASSVKKAVSIPVFAKATATNVDYLLSAKALDESGIDGIVTMGSQLGVPPIDIYRGGRTLMPNVGLNSTGGLTGPVNRLLALRLISNVAMNTKLTILGGGGITEWQHCIESIMFGSTLTPICSKFLWDGFEVIPKMNEAILRFMEEQGYETIADMRGLALKYLVPSDKIEAYDVLPHFDRAKCVRCGMCLKIGYCTALYFDENKNIQVDGEKCQYCGLCASLCPRKAIYFPRDWENQ